MRIIRDLTELKHAEFHLTRWLKMCDFAEKAFRDFQNSEIKLRLINHEPFGRHQMEENFAEETCNFAFAGLTKSNAKRNSFGAGYNMKHQTIRLFVFIRKIAVC